MVKMTDTLSKTTPVVSSKAPPRYDVFLRQSKVDMEIIAPSVTHVISGTVSH